MCSCKACVFFFIPSCFPSWENYSLPTCTALSKVSGTKWAVSKCLFRSYRYRKVDNLTFGRDQSPLLRKSRLRELNLGAEQTNGGGGQRLNTQVPERPFTLLPPGGGPLEVNGMLFQVGALVHQFSDLDDDPHSPQELLKNIYTVF